MLIQRDVVNATLPWNIGGDPTEIGWESDEKLLIS
jgi:hypothetical protein